MSRVLVTGSADGLGRAAAQALLDAGHTVVVHARSAARLSAVRDLLDRGATGVVGNLADEDQVRALADQVNGLGALDAVIHNAGVLSGPQLLPVNVVAPYLLTALVHRPPRLVYLSSSMHLSGRPVVAGLDWSGRRPAVTYSDTKLFVTALAAAVARLWPEVVSQAVDPGWVPTRMGGPGATDDLDLGHVTQVWLAVSDDAAALETGGYWYHQRRQPSHDAVGDLAFQDAVLDALASHTGVRLAPASSG
ncbi:MAG: SDR family NAD(P)-dependent oxidoreductase [Vicinamibacterales bacterium]